VFGEAVFLCLNCPAVYYARKVQKRKSKVPVNSLVAAAGHFNITHLMKLDLCKLHTSDLRQVCGVYHNLPFNEGCFNDAETVSVV